MELQITTIGKRTSISDGRGNTFATIEGVQSIKINTNGNETFTQIAGLPPMDKTVKSTVKTSDFKKGKKGYK